MIAFVAIIIGVSFLTPVADAIAGVTGTFTRVNGSFTAVNETNVTYVAAGQNNSVILQVYNNETIKLTEGANYTVNAALQAIIMNASFNRSSQTWFINYTYTTNDFINDSGTRSITNLLILFFALAIMAAGFIAVSRSGLLDDFR